MGTISLREKKSVCFSDVPCRFPWTAQMTKLSGIELGLQRCFTVKLMDLRLQSPLVFLGSVQNPGPYSHDRM